MSAPKGTGLGDVSGNRDRWIPLLAGALGIALFFPVTWTSGFQSAEGLGVDVRQAHYVLEWYRVCASGSPLCERIADLAYLHPAAGAIGFGDPTPAQGLAYTALRVFGFGPDVAYRILIVLLSGAAYAAALFWLRRVLGFGGVAAAAGAYLFAFGSPRAAQMDHPHLLATFPVPLLLAVLALALDEEETGRRRRLWAAAGGLVVLQAYLNLTIAWLVGLLLALVAAAALATRTRSLLFARLRSDGFVLAATAGAAALALWPLLGWMLAGRAQVLGSHTFGQVEGFLPRPESWLFLGPQNRLWGWLWDLAPMRALPFEWEHELGIGPITFAGVLAGVWRLRRHRWSAPLALGAAAAVLLVTRWPGGLEPWRLVHAHLPGATAVRAVGRVCLVLLAPAAAALAAVFVDAARSAGRASLAAGLALLGVVALEQSRDYDVHRPAEGRERVRALAAAIPADCPSFYYSPVRSPLAPWVSHVDAMWASLAAGRPTVNGYSSYAPLGWSGLHENAVNRRERRLALRDQLSFWAAWTGLGQGDLCWILASGEGDSLRVMRVERIDPAANPFTFSADHRPRTVLERAEPDLLGQRRSAGGTD